MSRPLTITLIVSLPLVAVLAASLWFWANSEPSLRSLADRHGVFLGAAIRPDYLDDADYARLLKTHFNIVTPENDLKWEMIRLSPTNYDFSGVDVLMSFAEKNRMAFRGHTLVWHNQNPRWLDQLPEDRAVWEKTLKDHILTVVGHYRGRIRDWDVVNEVVADDGSMRETVWSKRLGPDYIAQAFRWAREADPSARLFINDYSIELPGAKSDRLYALVKDLLAQGVPIDGVGFQGHIQGPEVPNFEAVQTNFQRFADLGLEVQITELDVRLPEPADEAALESQAVIYAGFLRVLLEGGYGKTAVVWGVSDKRSWVPGFFAGYGSALLFDKAGKPKPAVKAWAEVLERLP